MLTAMVMLTALLLFTAIFQGLFNTNRQINRGIKKFLDLNDKRKLGKSKFNLLIQMQLFRQNMKEKVLTKKKSDRLEQMISRSGVAMAPEEYVMFQWIVSLLLGALLLLITNNIIIAIFGVAIGFMSPRFWIKKKTQERMKKFNDGLEDMIMTI